MNCGRSFHPVVAPDFLKDKIREKFDVLSLADAAKRRNSHELDVHHYRHNKLREQPSAPFNAPDTDGFMPRRIVPA